MPYSHLAPRSPHASKHHSFLVGLGQMVLMSTNIRNIANGHIVFGGMLTIINTYVWLYVVRNAIHATAGEKFFYALGSAAGTMVGIALSHYIVEPHAFTHLSALFNL